MSTNISKEQRDNLISKINSIRTYIAEAPQNENTGTLLVSLSDLEKEVRTKKYGLVFEEHREEIDEILAENVPVLTEKQDLFINNGSRMNFLIEGDNLASLQILLKTHRGKIDLIYIDPPYNTLKEGFSYSDMLVDKNDTFRHSKWCSFMLRRLEHAKILLSNIGVIFISIDDNEVGTLRLLCDQIFGYQNFIANVVWEKKFSPQNDAKWLSDSHDHILVYAKNKDMWHPNLLNRTEAMDRRYSNPDDDPRGVWASSDFTVKTASEAYMYPITTPSGRVVTPTASRSWVTSKENFEALKKDKRIWFGVKGRNVPRIKTFLSEVQQGTVCKTIWYRAEVGDTQEGTKDLKSVFGKAGMFTNPKPLRLIERILNISLKSKNAVILDFFAGSGTTAHAVMKLNAEDGGNRRFIVCTNNENNICREVTYERIRRVIDRDNYKESLKYYFVNYISQKDEDGNPTFFYDYAPKLLEHVRELVELENGINFKESSENYIVLTDEDADAFFEDADVLNLCKRIYIGHDVLLSAEQEEKLKSLEIELIIIPDYYYKGFEG